MTDVGTQTAPAGSGPNQPHPRHRAARTAFIAFLLLATMVWIGIAVGANMRAPGIIGLAATVFGGLSAAVLTAAIGGWIALKIAAPDATTQHEGPPADPALAPALAELERLQAPVVRRMSEQAAWRMPVCAALGIALWCVIVMLGLLGGVPDFMAALIGGGMIGYAWAYLDANREHGAIYREKAVNTLAGALGLSWRKTSVFDLSRLRVAGAPAPGASSHGELSGVHAGVEVRIAPVVVTGVEKPAARSWLLIELESPAIRSAAMEDFAKDHAAAISQIDQLATLPGLGKPMCAVAPGRLTIAVPDTGSPAVFDPPREPGPAAASPRLSRVWQAASAVLQIADALSAPQAA